MYCFLIFRIVLLKLKRVLLSLKLYFKIVHVQLWERLKCLVKEVLYVVVGMGSVQQVLNDFFFSTEKKWHTLAVNISLIIYRLICHDMNVMASWLGMIKLNMRNFQEIQMNIWKKKCVINFDIIHAECRADNRQYLDRYYQTVSFEHVKKNTEKKTRALGTCYSSDRKDLFVEKI